MRCDCTLQNPPNSTNVSLCRENKVCSHFIGRYLKGVVSYTKVSLLVCIKFKPPTKPVAINTIFGPRNWVNCLNFLPVNFQLWFHDLLLTIILCISAYVPRNIKYEVLLCWWMSFNIQHIPCIYHSRTIKGNEIRGPGLCERICYIRPSSAVCELTRKKYIQV